MRRIGNECCVVWVALGMVSMVVGVILVVVEMILVATSFWGPPRAPGEIGRGRGVECACVRVCVCACV